MPLVKRQKRPANLNPMRFYSVALKLAHKRKKNQPTKPRNKFYLTDSIVNKISGGGIKTNSVDLEDDEDSAQDFEGSADLPLDF